MIEFKEVRKSFGSLKVLNGVSFAIEAGEIAFVLGKSGTGKSVLLKCIVGLLQPESGEIWVDGTKVTGLGEYAYFPVRKNCGMVFQFPALFDAMTVLENLKFGPRAHRTLASESELKKKAERLLELVNLDLNVLKRRPYELSFGMQKRVAIARALMLDPKYLLFDEPTTGLDPVSTRTINKLIERLAETLNVTALVVSHDMQCALEIADHMLFLDSGKVLAQGSVAEMMKCKEPLVEAFLKEAKERMHEAEGD